MAQLKQLHRENEEIRAQNRKLLRAQSREWPATPSEGEQSSPEDSQGRPSFAPSRQDTSRPSGTRPRTEEIGTKSRIEETTQKERVRGDKRPRLPFTDDIDEVIMPRNFKPLNIDKFNGTTDPSEYVESFVSSVYLVTDSEAVMCKIFPTTLQGSALTWLTNLPPRSINSFYMLITMFTAQFAASRKHKKHSVSLLKFRQEKYESLGDYMARFSAQQVLIPKKKMNHLEIIWHTLWHTLEARTFL